MFSQIRRISKATKNLTKEQQLYLKEMPQILSDMLQRNKKAEYIYVDYERLHATFEGTRVVVKDNANNTDVWLKDGENFILCDSSLS